MTDEEVARSVERVRLELVGRKVMVMVLAHIGVWVGLAIMLTGAPDFIEDWYSPWSRYSVGGLAFLGGVLAAIGGALDEGRRGRIGEVLGLALLVLWYTGMAVAYVRLSMEQGLAVVAPGEPLPEGYTGRVYVPLVYLGLGTMTTVPLVTILRLRRPGVA